MRAVIFRELVCTQKGKMLRLRQLQAYSYSFISSGVEVELQTWANDTLTHRYENNAIKPGDSFAFFEKEKKIEAHYHGRYQHCLSAGRKDEETPTLSTVPTSDSEDSVPPVCVSFKKKKKSMMAHSLAVHLETFLRHARI